MRTHVYTHRCAHVYAQVRIATRTHVHMCTHTGVHTHMHTRVHAQVCTPTRARTCTRMGTHMHRHTSTPTHVQEHIHVHTCVCACMGTHVDTHTWAHVHTHEHIHTSEHMHAHARTHVHTHSPPLNFQRHCSNLRGDESRLLGRCGTPSAQKYTGAQFSPEGTWSLFCLMRHPEKGWDSDASAVPGREQRALEDSRCLHGQHEAPGTRFPRNRVHPLSRSDHLPPSVPGLQAPAAVCPT